MILNWSKMAKTEDLSASSYNFLKFYINGLYIQMTKPGSKFRKFTVSDSAVLKFSAVPERAESKLSAVPDSAMSKLSAVPKSAMSKLSAVHCTVLSGRSWN